MRRERLAPQEGTSFLSSKNVPRNLGKVCRICIAIHGIPTRGLAERRDGGVACAVVLPCTSQC